MGQPKISFVQLERLIREGNGVSQAARILGVTKGAVSRALKRMNLAVTKDVALRAAPQVIEKKIDAVEQLNKINAYANELLDLLMRWNRGDAEALQVLESQVASKKVRVGDEVQTIREFKFTDPRQLALRAMGEIRDQLSLQHEIFRSLYDLTQVMKFQETVLDEIGKVSADVRDRIMLRLTEANAIRSSISFPCALGNGTPHAWPWVERPLGPELQKLIDEVVDGGREVASPQDDTQREMTEQLHTTKGRKLT